MNEEVLLNRRFLTILTALAAAAAAAPFASAQQVPANIAVAMGNGQLVCSSGCTNAPPPTFPGTVYAVVTDANNQPIPNYPVTWNVLSGPAIIAGGSTFGTNTAADGSTSVAPFFNIGFVNSGSFLQSAITVTAGSITQTFTVTDAIPCTSVVCGAGNGFSTQQVFADFNCTNVTSGCTPLPVSGLSGTAGGTAAAFTVRVYSIFGGQPLSGVSVRLINDDGTSGPSTTQTSAYCQTGAPVNGSSPDPYSVLTDANGFATCTPQFGPVGDKIGTSQHQVSVLVGGIPAGIWSDGRSIPGVPAGTLYNPSGITYNTSMAPYLPQDYAQSQNINISVKGATIGSITIVSGNNQTANPGQALPAPLVAVLKDTSGNTLATQGVVWTVSPAAAATLSNQTNATNANGQVSASLTFSSTANGPIRVTVASATNSGVSVNFTENAVPPVVVTSLNKVGGDSQNAVVGTAFATPLQVQIVASSGSVANVPVSFSVSGPAALSATSAVTNSSGIAQVSAIAGSTPGNVTVTASVGSTSVTFNLVVVPQQVTISASSFVNGADQQRGAITACGLATITQSGISPAVTGTIQAPLVGPLPLTLGNTTVAFNTNDYAPIVSVSANAITFLLPCDVAAGSVPVLVNAGGATATGTVTVQPAAPGIFSTVQSDGVSRAVIERPDGSFVSPSNPARRGEFVTAFVTGLGPVAPSVATNALPIPNTPSTVSGQVIVGVNSEGTTVQSAQLSPDRQGLYLVTFQIPNDAPAANNVVFSVGVVPPGSSQVYYSAGSQIPVQ
jgi:uncharacterized protein (TIGR03437 family)